MLKTNGSVAARDEYSNTVGSLVTIPARTPADRSPYGYIEYSITYRFAGVHQPGVALSIPKPLKVDTEKEDQIVSLQSQVTSLTSLLS